MRSTIITLVLGAAVTSLASAAAAEPQTIRIPVTQADLQSPEAVAALYGRVEAAAAELCQVQNRTANTTQASCMRDVVSDAVAGAELAPLAQYAAAQRAAPGAAIEIASR
jgi:UrcA family protein